ncbi:MAG TPA: hypothetical protein VK745_26795 [Polyangiaceae bacterium]|jgi:hypothetical protein|nr:hypothetical protein [Polyangiaceae bacterium]
MQHEYVASSPRFRGLANSAAPAGAGVFVSIGLTEALPRRNLCLAGGALGLIEDCAILSVLTLLATQLEPRAMVPLRRVVAPFGADAGHGELSS